MRCSYEKIHHLLQQLDRVSAEADLLGNNNNNNNMRKLGFSTIRSVLAASLLLMLLLGLFLSSLHGTSSFSITPSANTISNRPRSRRRIEEIPQPSHNSVPPLGASKKNNEEEKEEEENLSNAEIARYSRHLVLQNVGVAGQKALKNATVLVIGAGGLGSPCLLYLAAAGVGHVGIVDADTVDESNLQRQIIHGTSTINMTKCRSAQRRIHDINPHVHVRLYEEEFTSATALRILGDGFDERRPYDVVVDGSDNFPTKYLINDACAIVGTPWVYSAILAFEGQLSVFNWKNQNTTTGPDYRDLLPTPPPPGDVPSCAEGGVLGVLPGTMGCLQATETIKILLEKNQISNGSSKMDICSGRVLVFDALRMKFNHVGLARTEGREAITELIDYQGFCGGPQSATAPPTTTSAANTAASEAWTKTGGRTMDEVHTSDDAPEENSNEPSFHAIEPQAAMEKLVNGWSPWVLDVRLQTESDIVSLPFTDRLVPHRTVRMRDVPKTGDVLVYCKAGVRGKKACHRLIEQGVEPKRLYNLEGGILRWQKDVDPTMPRY